mmetsp:Transcript_19575/g.32647  ORF Transcript_19575/g.32647 Transcript_19575/m.32647 type:complete len:350 (-) Transcript_19575:124-1173(-)
MDADTSLLGTPPSAIIGGFGKCGTNFLGYVLSRYKGAPLSARACVLERIWQGWCGEINWPCDESHWIQEHHAYLQHFQNLNRTEDGAKYAFTYDKSTSYTTTSKCPVLIASALLGPGRPFTMFLILCDPFRSVWSRMNHVNANPAIYGYNKGYRMTISDVLQIAHQFASVHKPIFRWLKPFNNNSAAGTFGYHLQKATEMDLVVANYIKAFGNALALIISEKSEACPSYAYSRVACALGLPIIPVGQPTLVNSHRKSPGYLEPRGAAYDEMVRVLKSTFLPIYMTVRSQLLQHEHEDIAAWWNPSMFNDTEALAGQLGSSAANLSELGIGRGKPCEVVGSTRDTNPPGG